MKLIGVKIFKINKQYVNNSRWYIFFLVMSPYIASLSKILRKFKIVKYIRRIKSIWNINVQCSELQ